MKRNCFFHLVYKRICTREKALFLPLLLLLFSASFSFNQAKAQQIIQAEYFTGEDPGPGNATEIPIVPGQQIEDISFSADISDLEQGFHNLFVRAKDENGKWSLTNTHNFYKDQLLPPDPLIVKAEYFFNEDPGVGNASEISIVPGQQIEGISFSADISELEQGFHNLYLRAKDENGKWSLTNTHTFYKDQLLPPGPQIVKAEYFFNEDPGVGNASEISIVPGQQIEGISFTADISHLEQGFHNLYLRAKDENGKWSLTSVRSFYKETLEPSTPDITEAEYFFNEDPGIGNGTPISVSPGQNIEVLANASLSELVSEGPNLLYIRAKDSRGRWSLTNIIEFFIDKQVVLVSEPEDGGTLSGAGWYEHGYELTISATPNTGYQFEHWTEQDTLVHELPEYSFTVEEHRTLTAHFSQIQYNLSLTANPPEAGSTSGEGTYAMGEEVFIEAIPEPGWAFLNWTDQEGNLVSEEAAFDFSMPAEDVSLTANFSEIPVYTLALEVNPENAGTVEGGGEYEAGTPVSISASAAEGFAFVNWTDEEENELSDNPDFDYTMPEEDVVLTANFSEIPVYTLTLEVNPENAGTVEGGGEYEAGTPVSITASAAEGFAFVNWTDEQDNEIANEPDFIFTMPEAHTTLFAYFEAETGISKILAGKVEVYPNPAQNRLNIESPFPMLMVRFIDLQGRKVLQANAGKASHLKLDTTPLEEGIYLLQIIGSEAITTKRVQIRR